MNHTEGLRDGEECKEAYRAAGGALARSARGTQSLPITPLATIQPSIALARAVCPGNYRERLAQKPHAFDVMKDARVAARYISDLLRQLMTFLVSYPPFAHQRGVNPADLQILASVTHSSRRSAR